MFILRRFSGQGVEMNHTLGKDYTLIHRETNPGEFREIFQKFFHKPHVADLDPTADDDTKNVFAFVSGDILQPLYKNQKNYIMTESGKTFCHLFYD